VPHVRHCVHTAAAAPALILAGLIVRIGFTGTRQGMTLQQERDLLASRPGAIRHHGDCIGADAQRTTSPWSSVAAS